MPERPLPVTVSGLVNSILERLRAVERMVFRSVDRDEFDEFNTAAYSWQSAKTLVPGYGHRLHADRNGIVRFIRAERSYEDGVTAAVMDVELNEISLFPAGSYPSVQPGERVGSERHPDPSQPHQFAKGDGFRVKVLNTGGGTGPLRLTIHYTPIR